MNNLELEKKVIVQFSTVVILKNDLSERSWI